MALPNYQGATPICLHRHQDQDRFGLHSENDLTSWRPALWMSLDHFRVGPLLAMPMILSHHKGKSVWTTCYTSGNGTKTRKHSWSQTNGFCHLHGINRIEKTKETCNYFINWMHRQNNDNIKAYTKTIHHHHHNHHHNHHNHHHHHHNNNNNNSNRKQTQEQEEPQANKNTDHDQNHSIFCIPHSPSSPSSSSSSSSSTTTRIVKYRQHADTLFRTTQSNTNKMAAIHQRSASINKLCDNPHNRCLGLTNLNAAGTCFCRFSIWRWANRWWYW